MSDNVALDRLNTLANNVRRILSTVKAADETRNEIKEAADGASKGAVNAREQTMLDLAVFSQENALEAQEITSVLASVKKGNNVSDKAIETFMGEAAHAMHPNVREYAHGILALRNTAWDNETAMIEATKGECPKPVRLAFSRKYHLLITMFQQAKTGQYLREERDVIEFCEGRNPLLNPETQAKRVAKAVAELLDVYKNFDDDDLKSAADILAKVTKDTLAASRKVEVRAKPVPVVLEVQAVKSSTVVEETPTESVELSQDDAINALLDGGVI